MTKGLKHTTLPAFPCFSDTFLWLFYTVSNVSVANAPKASVTSL